VDTKCTEGMKKAIQLDLRLRVVAFVIISGNGAKTQGSVLSVFTVLGEDPAYCMPG
jgi:hypothetical protein